jgi:tripartite-type tricarboxylate transporter receptor subunit TctC
MRRYVPILIAFGVASAVATAPAALAQIYPSRPITIVAPFPAGGSIDTVARVIGERMKSRSVNRSSLKTSLVPVAVSESAASRMPWLTATPSVSAI